MSLTVCKECGCAFVPEEIPVLVWGKQVSTDSRFCPHCGKNGFAKPGKTRGVVAFFAFCVLAVLVVKLIGHHDTESTTPAPTVSEKETRQSLREALDPTPSIPLTPKQHLEAAKRLLAEVNINESISDVLLQLVSEHGTEARKDPRIKAQADVVMKRMANKALEVVGMKVWNAPMAAITAEVVCKHSIEGALKAPATADWVTANTGRWRDHPGYFLSTQTVDAQNSFGAKLRSTYECQVVCLAGDACEVEKLNEIER